MEDPNYDKSNMVVSEQIRNYTMDLISYIEDNVKDGPYKQEAIKNYRQALMWTNYTIYN